MLMSSDNELIVIDEWTSVVDRTVAKVMSHCLRKFVNKNSKRAIILSCHADVIEWLKPDWMIDCNRQEFVLPKSDAFFLRREKSSRSQSDPLTDQHGDFSASIII